MIHIEFIPSTLLGISLTAVGFFLCLIRTKEPMLSREYDLFFSSAGFLCGGILIFEGWRLDPILLLCQILSSGIAIFFIIESLLLRRSIGKTVKTMLFPLAEGSMNIKNKNAIIKYNKFLKKKSYKQLKLIKKSSQTLRNRCHNYSNPIEYKKTYPIDYSYLIEIESINT